MRDGRRYHLFPGGRVEPGETPEQAARREAVEELALGVDIGCLGARATFGAEEQVYYFARATGGIFGSGRGDEMTGAPVREVGSYRAVRWPINELPTIELRPAERSSMIQRAPPSGWPEGVTELSS